MKWITARPYHLSGTDKQALGLLNERANDASERRFLVSDGRGGLNILNPDNLPPKLFLDFATRTPITEEVLLAFAERYGPLLGDTYSQLWIVNEQGEFESPYSIAESFDVWEYEIKHMRLAVGLREVLQFNGLGIEKYVERLDDHFLLKDPYYGMVPQDTASAPVPPVKDDLIQVAKRWLMGIIQSHLRNRVTAAYLHQKFKLEMKAPGLIGALWLQLARAVDEKAYFKKCVICGEYFKTNRPDPETDKPKCRKEKSRREKRRDHLLKLVEETPGASWEDRLERWEAWREDDLELLRIKTADALKDAYETAKTQPGYVLKF